MAPVWVGKLNRRRQNNRRKAYTFMYEVLSDIGAFIRKHRPEEMVTVECFVLSLMESRQLWRNVIGQSMN